MIRCFLIELIYTILLKLQFYTVVVSRLLVQLYFEFLKNSLCSIIYYYIFFIVYFLQGKNKNKNKKEYYFISDKMFFDRICIYIILLRLQFYTVGSRLCTLILSSLKIIYVLLYITVYFLQSIFICKKQKQKQKRLLFTILHSHSCILLLCLVYLFFIVKCLWCLVYAWTKLCLYSSTYVCAVLSQRVCLSLDMTFCTVYWI